MYQEKNSVNEVSDNICEQKSLFAFGDNSPARSINELYYHFWYNQKSAYHTHDFYELFVVTEGAVKHNYNGSIELLKPGALVTTA